MNISQWMEHHLQEIRERHTDEEQVAELFDINIKKPTRLLADTLKYLDNSYGISRLYYAGSGFDPVPRETLGVERVVHLSLEERFFPLLGVGCNNLCPNSLHESLSAFSVVSFAY